jgi:predicted SprT family Zn-dependent metalloprotease
LGKPGDCNLPDTRYVARDSGDVNNRLYSSLGSFLRIQLALSPISLAECCAKARFEFRRQPKGTSNTMILQSIITCPRCGIAKKETMPTDACQYFYECTGCGTKLRPERGDCCVFCS